MPSDMRQRWLDEGLEALRESGMEALRIDGLAKHLPVTKGSFYAHFESKADYVKAMCEHWRAQAMPMDVDRFFEQPGRLSKKLLALMRYVEAGERSRYDAAMRELARVNANAADAVETIDRARLEFSYEVFRRVGFEEAEAKARGSLLYGWLLASIQIGGGLPEDVEEVCMVLGEGMATEPLRAAVSSEFP